MTRFGHWLMIVALSGLAFGVRASAEPPAQILVKSTTGRVLEVLKTDSDKIEQHPEHLYKIVDEFVIPHFDFSRMSKRVLGKYWRKAGKEQRARFVEQFRALLVRTYAMMLNEYKDETIDYLAPRTRSKKNEISVRTRVSQQGGSPIPITYDMYLKDQDWKVYDVSIDGVSLIINYRATFRSEIRRNGLNGLIARLAKKNQGGK